MIYFGFYWMAAAVYGLCMTLWCTAHYDIMKEVFSEYELEYGVRLDYNKCFCLTVVVGSVIWPIGTIGFLIIKIYYFIQKQKLK